MGGRCFGVYISSCFRGREMDGMKGFGFAIWGR